MKIFLEIGTSDGSKVENEFQRIENEMKKIFSIF